MLRKSNGRTGDLVLTLQSSVAFGHVGNAAAAFALQRLGRDVVRIDTVRFSNHPKHGGYAGGPAPAAEIDALVEGLRARGLLAHVGAALSGYLGTAENAGAVARAVESLRAVRPDALYCLDPVIGDRPAGRFVAPDVPDAIRTRLLPLADILTPNAFELETLTGAKVETAADAVAAARSLMRTCRATLVVATGLGGPDSVLTAAVTADGAWRAEAPRVEAPAYGAGDLFGALFLARILDGQPPDAALGLAANAMAAVFATTRRLGRPELALVEAQAELADPPRTIPVEEV